MPRQLRIEYEGAIYHVMNRGDRREAIFKRVSPPFAANMSTNNIALVQSDLALTITPLSGDAMNYATATVYGTVDDPDAVIMVNGVQGVNNYGYWEVDNVPLPPGGTVTLVATAQPVDGPATQTLLEEDRSPVVFTQTYGYALDFNWREWPRTNGYAFEHADAHWVRGVGGTNVITGTFQSEDGGSVGSEWMQTGWPADGGYLPALAGQKVQRSYTNGVLENQWGTTNISAPGVEWMENSDTAGSGPDAFDASWTEQSGREVRLFTGGKALRQRQGLFDLSDGLTVEQVWSVPDLDLTDAVLGQLVWTGTNTVPPEQIALGALGNQGDDGHLWTVQPDGKEIVITPAVAGGSAEGISPLFRALVSKPTSSADSALNITGSLPGNAPYSPTITANSIALSNDVVATGANFCVGQDVPLVLSGLPSGVTATNFQWTLGGTFVNDHTNALPGGSVPNSSENYFENQDLLKNAMLTNCWWVSGGFSPPLTYQASVTCTLIFTNGNAPVGISASGLFTMFRPSLTLTNSKPLYFTADSAGPFGCVLALGDRSEPKLGRVDYTVIVHTATNFPGYTGITQVGDFNYSYPSSWLGQSNALDNTEFYYPYILISGQPGQSSNIGLDDGPSVPGWLGNPPRLQVSFTDYIRFQPYTGNNSIFVTLGIIFWSIHGEASPTMDDGWPITTDIKTPPDHIQDSSAFPNWTNIIANPR